MTIESYEIAPYMRSDEFGKLNLDVFPHDDWGKAIAAFKSRFESRFFNPLTRLSGSAVSDGDINGFIVLSCTFMLVETLGGFRTGATDHRGKSPKLFVEGLADIRVEAETGAITIATEPQKCALYSNGRCALLHTSGTEKIRVTSSGPAIKIAGRGFEINRDEFLDWVRSRFNLYADDLAKPKNNELRQKFRIKMTHIANS